MTTRNRTIRTCPAALLPLLLAVAGCSAPSRTARTGHNVDTVAIDFPDVSETRRGATEEDHWRRELAERYFLEGSLLQMQERYADAIIQFQRALRFMPGNYSVVHFAIARCYQAMGATDTALVYSREAVQRDPDNLDARMQLASLMIANGRLGGASREYEEVLRRQPGNLQARYSLARLLQWSDPERSAEHYEYLRRNVDESEEILLSLSELYLNLGRYDQAIGVMRELMASEPASADIYALLAEVYVRAGQYEEGIRTLLDAREHLLPPSAYTAFAIERLDAVVRNLPVNNAGYANYARALADSLGTRLSGSWEVTLHAGLVHYHLGDAGKADSLILHSLSDEEATAEAWTEAAVLYVNDGRSERGLGFMLPTALRYDDDYHVPYLIGYAFLLMDRYDSAEHYLRRSVAMEQRNSDAWGHLAFIYNQQGKVAAGDNAYERALEHDPYNPTLLNNFAYSLADRGKRLEKALGMVERALEAEPENESYLDTRGWIYFRMERYEDAARDIQQAVDVGGASSEVLLHLGEVRQALGDRDAARQAYERALRLKPGDEHLLRKLEAVR